LLSTAGLERTGHSRVSSSAVPVRQSTSACSGLNFPSSGRSKAPDIQVKLGWSSAYGGGNGGLPEHVATLCLLHIPAVQTLRACTRPHGGDLTLTHYFSARTPKGNAVN
jgi:hypothetical protein